MPLSEGLPRARSRKVYRFSEQTTRKFRESGPRCATSIPIRRRSGSRSSGASCWAPTRASIQPVRRPGAGLRELWERFSAFMDRFHVAGWRRWVFVEPLSEGATLGAGGLVVHAGAGDPGVPRDLGRRLAEEVRARGHLPRPLRQRGRLARHQAQRLDPARRVPRPPDQGDARDRRPALLRAFRHRPRPARSARC